QRLFRRDQAHGAPDHRFGGVRPNGHLSQLVPDGTEISDGIAERFALLGVAKTYREHVLGGTDREGAELQTPGIENVERDYVAASDFPQYVLDRPGDVVEIDGSGRAALNPHLLFFGAAGDAAEGSLDEEGRKLFAIDLRKHREEVGCTAVRDP